MTWLGAVQGIQPIHHQR